METEVKKRAWNCFLLWTIFVAIKWIMLLSPSSILSKLSPLMVVVKDGHSDYVISGWISLGIETALVLGFFFISRKKISVLYIICGLYAMLYVPAVVYWIFTLGFEIWRYVYYLPVALCAVIMLAGFSDYINQQKLKMPKKKAKADDKEEEGEDAPDEDEKEEQEASAEE